ncbi:MAG TPA: amino acid adenylation domain-containing protein, partial [Pyrinomonadaceae bacterium]
MDRRNVEDIYPLSPMQQGMLFHSLFAPAAGSYVVQISCALDGGLDVAALMRAWRQLIERHTILRTAFVWESLEQPLQVVQRRVSIPLDERDWRGLPAAEQARRLEEYLREDQLRDFDFARAPLMRLALLRLGDDEYRFVWSFHHVLLDGWSVPLVLNELFALYEAHRRGRSLSLEPRRPYRDYIEWLQKQSLARAEAFWRQHLKGFTAPTPLGVDRARKAAPEAGQPPYAERELSLPRQPLQDAARRDQLTLNTFIQGAWALLLARYSGEPEVVFGAIGSGRPAEIPGIEAMVGLFINTLPVRVAVPGGARLLPWLRRLQEQQSELRQYEYTPLVQVQKWSEAPQDGPLFETVVVFENYPVGDSLQSAPQEAGGGGGVRDVRHVAGTNYPLTLVVEIGSELVFKVLYEKARFEDETVMRLLGHLRTLLEAMAADPELRLSRLPLLTEAERRQVIREWNDTAAEIPEGCFHQLFEAQAERRPEAVALLHAGGQVTYAELNRRANRLAHHLRARGVGAETLVGVCVERSPEMIAAALAVLKAGGAYLPLDPAYPRQRLSFIMEDARVKLLLTQRRLLERLPPHSPPVLTLGAGAEWLESESEANPANVSSPEHLAYVIYTSGSTGRPKGVMVGQKGLSNLISAQAAAFGVGETSRVLQFASFSFDASVSEMAVTLASGATLCLPGGDSLLSGESLREVLRDWSVTTVTLPPTVLLNTDAGGLPSLRTVVAAGERCPREVAAKWGAGSCFINAYGPTESTVCATMHECRPAECGGAPAGRPDYPAHKCIQQLFEEQAARTPDAVAVVFGERHLTYRELDRRADLLARHLRRLGVGPEDTVGVCAERGPEMVVGLVAILKAGGAYLPLDPQYPQERLSFMFEDARPKALLTTRRLRDLLPAHQLPSVCLDEELPEVSGDARERLGVPADPEGLAYVVYTSGSTGRPKGVMVSHRNVVRLVRGTNYVALGAEDRVAQVSNESFDAFTFEVWGALLNGAQLVMLERDVALSPALLGKALAEQGVTTMFLTTSLFNQIAQTRPDALRGLRYVLFGGEAADAAAVRGLLEAGKPENLINAYGPTENTTFSTWKAVSSLAADATNVPIGRPITNSEAYVLGEAMEPVPVGVRGELYLGGDGLARGYLRRSALTAERFVPHPFSSEPGARLYRTGDIARYLPGGEIEFLGRLDDQVKIRGFRVELGEVEAALSSHPAVRECLVLLTEGAAHERRLVAYLVAAGAPAPSVTELRAYLEERLPHYMVPSLFVTLPEMPLTPNGKLDRKALPEPGRGRPALEGNFAEARTPVEEMLSNIWAQVLRLDGVGVNDNFFDLGGHSLTSIQIASRATEAFQVDVPVRAAFEAPTVAQLARRIEAQLRTRKGAVVEPIRPVGRGETLPLSFAQQRLWFLNQLDGADSAAYNVPTALRLSGRLDLDALERTIGEVVRRHEVLRTTFPLVDGQPRQRISEPRPVRLAVADLTDLPQPEREREAERLIAEEARRPFDLAEGPPLRASVLRLDADAYVLMLTMHHVVCDGWSMGVLVKEVGALYAAYTKGEASPLSEPPVQYADYAVWQRAW